VQGLHLDGGWNGAAGVGDHSAGVHVAGSQNVVVTDNLIENQSGDGVYVGGGGFTTAQSKNVTVRDNDIRNPYRCGVAVIHVNGLSITGNSLQKSNNYVTTIDIEPNPNGIDNVWNVTIDGNTFNSPSAVGVMLYHASGWKLPPGGLGGNVQISNNSGDVSSGVSNVSGNFVNVTQTNNAWK
jgi:hypothetical protein